jgi:hypothetical protein
MPTNVQMASCVARDRGALAFWSPVAGKRRPNTRVQIVDVFSLQVVSGYTRDPQGRLLLEAQSSLASARSWSFAKAAQLIRNDVRPYRWVALQQDRRAWGLFWAGGGLQHCRDLLVQQLETSEASSALVPATPEALLHLMLDVGAEPLQGASVSAGAPIHRQGTTIWRVVAYTSMAWLAILGITTAGLLSVLERQDRKLELLLERTAPSMLP